jgi:type II secretory pathway pseudopilin PulG
MSPQKSPEPTIVKACAPAASRRWFCSTSGQSINMRTRKQRGFILIELLAVMVAIMVLAALFLWVISQRATSDSRLNNAKLYCTGMILYAVDNQQHYPTNLVQTLPYLRQANLTPSSPDQFEILYRGSMDDLTNSIVSRIIVIRSKSWQDQDGNWERIYGFADGHCETQSQPNDNFDRWENLHSAVLNRKR